MQRVEAELAVNMSELKKDPGAIVDGAQGCAIAVLNHNRIIAYIVSADTYEAMMDAIDDQSLVKIAEARFDEKGMPASLGDL